MKKVLISNIALTNQFPDDLEIRRTNPDGKNGSRLDHLLELVKDYRSADCVLVLNADAIHAAAAMLAKVFFSPKPAVLFFDTLLKKPSTFKENILAKIEGLLFRFVDRFLAVHKDVSSYKKHYGIPQNKFYYVPFKANNFQRLESIPVRDEGYIFSGGASYRDYQCLIDASRGMEFPVKIVMPRAERAQYHNTIDPQGKLPDNVSIVRHDGDPKTWDDLMAGATLIVIPIVRDCIQPAGISVYLEAMALGKPVIISRGASTNGLIDESMAGLYTSGNAVELAQKIREMLDSRELRERIAANGRRYALSLQDENRLSRDLQVAALAVLGFDQR